MPFLFELHRTDVVQCRVQPCPVIPEQPVEGFVLGLAEGFEAHSMQPLDLEGAEQCLRAGVVPAVALAAHRGRDATLVERLVELVAGILTAAIAVEDQRSVLAGRALEPGHLQRVDDELASHAVAHRPAHDPATEQIYNYGQIQPSFFGWDISNIARPCPVRRSHGEVAIEQVGRDRKAMPAVGGSYAKTPLATGANVMPLHQPLHPQVTQMDALT